MKTASTGPEERLTKTISPGESLSHGDTATRDARFHGFFAGIERGEKGFGENGEVEAGGRQGGDAVLAENVEGIKVFHGGVGGTESGSGKSGNRGNALRNEGRAANGRPYGEGVALGQNPVLYLGMSLFRGGCGNGLICRL